MIRIYMFIVLAMTVGLTYAAGPANIDAGLVMWLDATQLNLNDNDPVSSWTDMSGNNRHATQGTAQFQPTFKANLINGQPGVLFSTDDFLEIDGNSIVNTNYSIFAVVRRTGGASGSTSNHNYFLGGTTAASNDKNLHVGWRHDTTFTTDQYTNEINTWVAPYNIVTEPAFVYTARHSSDSNLAKDTYINGGMRGLSMYAPVPRSAHLSEWSGASIGRYQDGSINTRFNGWLTELIFYNRYLSESERKAVEEYLGAKYGITIRIDPNGPSHYANYREAYVNPPSRLSDTKESGGMTLSVSSVTAYSRIRFGHNNLSGTINTYNPDPVDNPNFQRLTRQWYLDVASSNLNSDFIFDLSVLGSLTVPTGYEYRLLFRRCTCANFMPLELAPSVVGNSVSFSFNPIKPIEYSGFYTLGVVNTLDNTLPVELSSFSAIVTAQNAIRLNWTSQSETGLLGYYIYRSESSDLASAALASALIPAQNSSTVMHYSYTDQDLSLLTDLLFYWLLGLDLDGSESLFGPVQIQRVANQSQGTPPVNRTGLKAPYPNPFNPSLNIAFSLKTAGDAELEIFNMKGQKVETWAWTAKAAGEHRQVWNAQNLPSGVYILRFRAGDHSEQRRVMLSK